MDMVGFVEPEATYVQSHFPKTPHGPAHSSQKLGKYVFSLQKLKRRYMRSRCHFWKYPFFPCPFFNEDARYYNIQLQIGNFWI